MAKQQNKPLNARTLKADTDALAAIKKMGDYKSSKAVFALDQLTAAAQGMSTASDTHAQAEADLKTARDGHVSAQWAFHNAMLGARQQVVAQYGDDSEQVAAVGLTKKSERAKPTRAAAPAAMKKAA